MDGESVSSVKKEKDFRNFYIQKILICCELPLFERIQKRKHSFYNDMNRICSTKGTLKVESAKHGNNLYSLSMKITVTKDLFQNMGNYADYLSYLKEYGETLLPFSETEKI